tara:strand:- start:3172 stop:3534 length:363 start_codon:yes stop_codon:yes gene_type:complete
MQCEYFGQPKKLKRGSTGVETAAWMVFPFGIPYSMWRMLTKRKVCRECGTTNVLDADSPEGELRLNKILGVDGVELESPVAARRQPTNVTADFDAFMQEQGSVELSTSPEVKPTPKSDDW